LCCTQKIYATSIEAFYILEDLKEEDLKTLENLENYPRPKITHNQTILCYMEGVEPPVEEPFENLGSCPFLTDENLCKIYPKRPLMCRIMVSTEPCQKGSAQIPPFLFQVGTISMQLVENIDIGGVYGSLFDLLKFLNLYKKGLADEVPQTLLNNIDVDELPILPEEDELRRWVGALYRTPVNKDDLTFRELLNELRERFKNYETLDFLKEIF